jgi:hypothetical protein
MAAELAPADYAFLIILKAEGRELSNTEMDNLYHVRLVGDDYARLNAAGYVSSNTARRPYRHAITTEGLGRLASPLGIDEGRAEEGKRSSPTEKRLWAAVVAQQAEIVRLRAAGNGTVEVVEAPAGLDSRIRAGYTKLAGAPGDWVDLAELRPLLPDVPRRELDKALLRMHRAGDVSLEPDPLAHRIGADQRSAAVRVGGEDRHKLAIGRP